MPVTIQNKSLVKMVKIMTTQDLSFKVSFNTSGIAVSGDASLYGMWEEGKGICVTISQGFGGNRIMYRTIKHMTDYTGGANQWADVEDAVSDYESFIDRLNRLKH